MQQKGTISGGRSEGNGGGWRKRSVSRKVWFMRSNQQTELDGSDDDRKGVREGRRIRRVGRLKLTAQPTDIPWGSGTYSVVGIPPMSSQSGRHGGGGGGMKGSGGFRDTPRMDK